MDASCLEISVDDGRECCSSLDTASLLVSTLLHSQVLAFFMAYHSLRIQIHVAPRETECDLLFHHFARHTSFEKVNPAISYRWI
jgi:hypothetical protein